MQTKLPIDLPMLEQIVDRHPLQVPPDASILDAIILMSQGQQSSCVLVVEGGSLVGIFTERDVVRSIAFGMDLARTEIARAIEQPVIHLILDRNQNLSTALSLMHQHRIHHLPAVDELGQLVGLITRDRIDEEIASLESVEDTPHQQLEAELRLRQQQFASLVENSPDIIFRLDLKLRHIYISPSVIETSGLYPGEFLGKTGRELGLPVSACDVFEAACRDAIATGEITKVEYEIAGRHYISRLNPERSASGAIESLTGITEEICDRKQAEIQLRETSAALSHALEGISRLDERGCYTFVNQAYARTIGYVPEEAIGMSWQQTVHPDDLEPAAVAYQEMRSQGKAELEAKGLRKDGSVFDKHIVMVAVYNEQQQFVGHYCFMKDISDRKRAEAALKQSERKFRAIFDNTFGFMGLLSVEGIVVEVNQTALKVIAGDRSNIVGQPFWETPWWTHFPQQQEQLRQAIASAARGEFVRFETQHLWPDGTVAVVDFSLKPFVDEAGKIAMLIFEGRDIGDRKQLEIALQTSEEKLRLALDLNSIGIWEWNIATGVVFWNASHFFVLGYQPGEFEPSYQHWRDRVHPDDIGFAEEQIIQALETRADYETEFRLVLDDGSIRWLHSKGRGLYNDAGKPVRMVGVEYDITDRKQAEAALRHNQEMFSALVDNAPCGIYLVDAEFRLQRINQGAEAVFSNIDPLIGRDFAEILRIVWQEPFATAAIDRFRYTLATGESYYSPTIVEQRANIDEIEAYDWQIHRIALPDGSDGVVCYFYDLSEIKRAEEIIRRTAQRDAFLIALFDTLRPLADPMEIQAAATRILGEYLGANRALYFEVRGSDYVVERDYANGTHALAGIYPIDAFGQSLVAILRSGLTVVQPDVSADPSFSPEQKAAYTAIEISAHIGIPLIKDGELVAGLAVHMKQPRVWTPEEVTLAEEVAERTWAAIERARAEAALAKSEEKYRSLFDSIDEGFSPIEMIFDAAGKPINYRFLEVNQVFEQQTGLVGVTGKTILDVIPDFEGSIIEQYGRVAIEGKSVRFEQCVAAMDNSWFNVYASRIGGEGSRQVAVVFDNITDRKRREANLAFLAAIAEDFSHLSTVEEIIQAVGAKIGAHLQVTNCNFCEVDEVRDEFIYLGRWNAERGDRLPDRICLSAQTSEDFRRRVRAGETIVSQNTQTNPVTDAKANAAIGALSFVTVPFHKNGEWKYLFSIHDSIPHTWRSDEIELVRELANRTFPRLDRARAEAALRENEQLLRLALAGAKAGSWDWDLVTGKLAWSSQTYHLHGLDPTEGLPEYEGWYNTLLHPDDRQRVNAYVSQAIEQRLPEIAIEFRILHPQQGIRWLLSLGRPTAFNDRGKPIRLSGINLDLSDRKQAELALQESEKRLSLFVKHAPACVAMFDRNMSYLALSQRWVDLYHLGAIEAVVGCSHYELLPAIPERWRQVYRRGLEGLIQRCDEDRFILPDGSLQWLKWEVQPWETGTGEVGGILIFVEDISDRKLAEEKIREQAALLDIASDAIFVRDLENRILYWNQGAERLYGWTAEEAIDRQVPKLLQTEATQVSEITQTILDRGEWRGELQKIAKTGREVIVEASCTVVRDDAGQPKFILSVETDITEKKQLEAQFYHAQRLESLGTLASGIAHDLNNVLTPILAISQLLRYQGTHLDDRSQKMLQMLEDNSKRGANLVKQILTFARGNESERISLSVVSLLQEVVQIAQQTFPKSIAVSQNIPDPATLGLVSATPTQLHQVFLNLCVNARDAMPDGGTLAISAENYYVDEIFAQMHPDARVGNYVCVTVADTGTGIPPEIRDRIFEPFFTTKDIGKGTGLGLSILLGIVKSYGGFVEVRSQPGAGSQFKVYLQTLQAVPAFVEEQTNLPHGRGETILVVDDEVNILQVARTLLEAYNYRVLMASNGIEALARYVEHKHEIQVVLMDMMMPEMDGLKAIHTLQKMNPQVKIVAISGLSSDYRKKARSLGIDTFVSKPFTATELLQSIQTANSKP